MAVPILSAELKGAANFVVPISLILKPQPSIFLPHLAAPIGTTKQHIGTTFGSPHLEPPKVVLSGPKIGKENFPTLSGFSPAKNIKLMVPV